MKIFFRLFIVFGLLDIVVVAAEYFGGYKISGKIILGLISLSVGFIGLLILKTLDKK